MSRIIALVLFVACSAPQHGDSHHGAHSRRFDDLAEAIRMFESPQRDAYQKPDEVVAALRLRPTDAVADIGTGTGYFARRMARVVTAGSVVAVDIEPVLVDHVRSEAARLGLANLTAALGEPDDPKLGPKSVDVVLIVNTLHHIEARPAYLARLGAALRPGGRVVIVDYRMGKLPMGPPDAHKLSPEQVEAEFTQAGYHKIASHDFLPYQYMLEFAL